MKNHSLKLNLGAPICALALLALAAPSLAAVEDKINATYQVEPGGQLVVEADRGSIEVRTVDGDSVDIEVTRKAGGSQAKAEKTLRDHVVSTKKENNTVEVRAKYEGERKSWSGRSPELQVAYRITVPRTFDVNLKTAGGSINVVELTGKVDAHTSGGSLKFENITGPVTAHTSGGSVHMTTCQGKVDVKSSGGSLHFENVDGDINARTAGGSIHANKLTGQSVLKTSGGSIEASGIKGNIEAATAGGSISAKIVGQPTGGCSFKTSGGSVTIAMAETVAVDVDARTSAGRVSTDLPVVSVIQGEQKKNELRGKINGGGPLVTAHTSGGNVSFKKE